MLFIEQTIIFDLLQAQQSSLQELLMGGNRKKFSLERKCFFIVNGFEGKMWRHDYRIGL